MREIKFRGKVTEPYYTSLDEAEIGDWVEGFYYYCPERNTGIIVTQLQVESGGISSGLQQTEIEVDYETLGQFPGLTDKTGKKIFEDDIVKYLDESNTQQVGVVKYSDIGCLWYVKAIGGDEEGNQDIQLHKDEKLEIIGNIHNNLELLK
jgi:uncharacterized phage protein (TIGR01671 family)